MYFALVCDRCGALRFASTNKIVVCSFPVFSFIPETPRWLLVQGRIDEARKVFEKIAKSNGTVLTDDLSHLDVTVGRIALVVSLLMRLPAIMQPPGSRLHSRSQFSVVSLRYRSCLLN